MYCVSLCRLTVRISLQKGDWHSENDKTPLISSVSYFNFGGFAPLFGGSKPTKVRPWRRDCFQCRLRALYVQLRCSLVKMRLQCIGLKLLDVSKWRGRVFRMLRIGKFLLAASWPLTSCTARVWQELKYFAGSYVWLRLWLCHIFCS